MTITRRIRLAVCVLALTCVPVARAQEVDRVLAVVGEQVITLSDARAAVTFGFVKPAPGADSVAVALEYLVNRQLMLNEVDRYSAPEADAAAVAARMNALRAQFASQAAFDTALARGALTAERLRDFIGDNIRIDTYLDQRFAAQSLPTPDEVQRHYRDHPADFTRAGRLLPFDDVVAQVTERVTAERRTAAVNEWLDRLHNRVNVSNLYR